jgi:GDP-4-dehydro-6-deoxy-D-mannose reductase
VRKPTAFITGVAGFAGSYLAEELLTHGFAVSGNIYNNESTRHLSNIKKDIKLYSLDILSAGRCRNLIAKVKPDYIFHLAAMASVGNSFDRERYTYRINFEGTLNLLEAAKSLKRLKALLFVSSSDTYGLFKPQGKTLTEDQPLNPVSPYGISKSAAEQVCRYYYRQYDLPTIIARSFNHSGPRQGDRFVIPAFARQIAQIEAGMQKAVLKVGDLSARRDLSDVRDVVRGYRLAVTKGNPGEVYQFCSGRAVAIQTVLDRLMALSNRRIRLQVDKSRLRKAEIPILRGSNKKATQRLGYQVRYRLKDTLADTLAYWRAEAGLIP